MSYDLILRWIYYDGIAVPIVAHASTIINILDVVEAIRANILVQNATSVLETVVAALSTALVACSHAIAAQDICFASRAQQSPRIHCFSLIAVANRLSTAITIIKAFNTEPFVAVITFSDVFATIIDHIPTVTKEGIHSLKI